MPYIDQAFYDDVYKGNPVNTDAFSRFAERASDIIDQVTNFALVSVDFNNLHPVIQTHVKKAVAAQVEYLSMAGTNAVHGETSASNVSIGNFSYSEGPDLAGLSREQRRISPAALSYLRATGLLNRGVSVIG